MTSAATDTAVERIERYSVGHNTGPQVEPGEVVLLLPEPVHGEVAEPAGQRLRALFDAARAMTGGGGRVRVVAAGASLPDNWPGWIDECPNLVTTELGAYRAMHPIESTRDLARLVQDWLGRVAGDLSADIDAAESLYASMGNRFLQPLFEAVSYASGLAAAHPGSTFHCVDEDWLGVESLRTLVAPSGGRVRPEGGREPGHWRLRMAAWLGWRWLVAVGGQVRLYARAAPSRRRLAALRRPGSPRLWLALQPDWPRINRHVLEQVAGDPTAEYGVLLTTSLQPGDVTKPEGTKAVWPGIPEVLLDGPSPAIVDQIVGPDSLGGLVRGLVAGTRACVGAARRLFSQDNDLLRLAGGLDQPAVAQGVARLLTVDVLQAEMVGAAVRALVERRNVRGSVVVFSILNVVDTAAANSVLKRAGATTVDFRHGSGGLGWFGFHETFADFVLGRSSVDAKLVRMLGRAPLQVPPPRSVASRTRGRIHHLLITTGYCHESWRPSGFPLRHFEVELMRGAELLAAARPDLGIRWRPHPGDDAAEITARMARFPFLTLSQGGSLADDLAWADAVISYGGSTLTEAVQAGVPVLVHAMPSLLTYPDIALLGPERRFLYAADLPACFERLSRMCEASEEGCTVESARMFDLFFYPRDRVRVVTSLDPSQVGSTRPMVSSNGAGGLTSLSASGEGVCDDGG